jgi:hypothetical protein
MNLFGTSDPLSTFVPRAAMSLIQQPLSASPALSPKHEGFCVACIADVSGYSYLASKLEQRGKIGAEIMSKVLNSYFGKVRMSAERNFGMLLSAEIPYVLFH